MLKDPFKMFIDGDSVKILANSKDVLLKFLKHLENEGCECNLTTATFTFDKVECDALCVEARGDQKKIFASLALME